ncbi:MAG: PAS domain-containing protein, partial [Candidatus Hodarchaeota archaeon]
QREKRQLQTIFDHAPYGIIFAEGPTTLYVNPMFTEITGYTLTDIPTGDEWALKAYPDPHYREKVIKAFQEVIHQKKTGFEIIFEVVCKNGDVKKIRFRPTFLEDRKAILMISEILDDLGIS